MKEGYIIITKKRSTSQPQAVRESVSLGVAEEWAKHLYADEQLDTVVVAEVEVDPTRVSGRRLKPVLKIERTCKHPNIQGDMFIVPGGAMVCVDCGMVFKPTPVSSNIEETQTPSASNPVPQVQVQTQA